MNEHEKCFELNGSFQVGNITPQNPASTLEAMADELAREGNRPGGGRSELFRTGNLWEAGGF